MKINSGAWYWERMTTWSVSYTQLDVYKRQTSYKLVNGVHAAANYELCTTVAREEWGFQGLIMSDWNTTVPEDGTIPWQCAAAGNDVIMPGNMNDDVDIRRALEEGCLLYTS